MILKKGKTMIKKIVKRDGSVLDFDSKKIKNAMQKALDATKCIYSDDDLDSLEKNATMLLERQYVNEDGEVDIEEAQNVAEEVLASHGYFKASRAYIKYRESRKNQREVEAARDNFAVSLIEGGLGKVSDDLTEMSDPCADLDVIKNQNASTAGGTIGATILQSSEAVSKSSGNQYMIQKSKRCAS